MSTNTILAISGIAKINWLSLSSVRRKYKPCSKSNSFELRQELQTRLVSHTCHLFCRSFLGTASSRIKARELKAADVTPGVDRDSEFAFGTGQPELRADMAGVSALELWWVGGGV